MSTLARTLLATAIMGWAALSDNQLMAAEQRIEIEKHIDLSNEQSTELTISQDGNVHVYKFAKADLADEATLREKLSDLDEQTRESIIKTLQHGPELPPAAVVAPLAPVAPLAHLPHLADKNCVVVTEVDSPEDADTPDQQFATRVMVNCHDEQAGEHQFHRQIIVHKNVNEEVKATMSEAVIRLIEKGDFSPEMLDNIQQALDAKR